ncbi:hypothetical protein FB451DRAFT_1550256 [Mycena latifolia]|nr:hypothetical protein FB451DRAFT_1550256 [Mycena latifolia]
MLARLSRARVRPLTRCIQSQTVHPLSNTSKYAIIVGAVATATVIGTVWTSQPIALDAAHSPSPPVPKPTFDDYLRTKLLAGPGGHPPQPPSVKSQQDLTPEPAPNPAPSEPEPSQEPSQVVVQSEETADGAGDSGGGAFNPETGEINWDCPCLGGMAHGPCGPEFREAFSCFVHSEDEPKGINCVEKFQGMQTCFREHPEVYASEIADDDEAEAAERESALPGEREGVEKESAPHVDTLESEGSKPTPQSAPGPSEEAPSSSQQ